MSCVSVVSWVAVYLIYLLLLFFNLHLELMPLPYKLKYKWLLFSLLQGLVGLFNKYYRGKLHDSNL